MTIKLQLRGVARGGPDDAARLGAQTILCDKGSAFTPKLRGHTMKPCRECKHPISEQAMFCPQCGAPYPAKEAWTGWGWEYKSKTEIAGLPLLHVAFKYRPNRMPVVAKGIFAVGQFASGVVCVSQFGVGLVSISQFTLAGFAVAQFGIAWSLIAQIGIYVQEGYGQFVIGAAELLGGF